MMKREEFYNDEICCEVARVYCARSESKELHSIGWAMMDGVHANPNLSRKQCDALIKRMGSVKAAHEYAYEYLAGGCGVVG